MSKINNAFDTHKLVVKLDQDLQIYILKAASQVLIYEQIREGKILNLNQNFESIWTTHIAKYLFQEIDLLLGLRASFSDSRTIYIWCKTFKLFYPEKRFFCYQFNSDIDIEVFLNQKDNTIVADELLYGAEVRIGASEKSHS